MANEQELLFLDTFTQLNITDCNLDLVKFKKPVYIREIRVIPLGAKVQVNCPGGERLGATHPSSFKLDFFVNDLKTSAACVFHDLGSFDYDEACNIRFVSDKTDILTDGLVLRGLYKAVTLAVYGSVPELKPPKLPTPPPSPPKKEPSPPPCSVPSKARLTSYDHKAATAEWVQQHAQIYHNESYIVKDIAYDEVDSLRLDSDEDVPKAKLSSTGSSGKRSSHSKKPRDSKTTSKESLLPECQSKHSEKQSEKEKRVDKETETYKSSEKRKSFEKSKSRESRKARDVELAKTSSRRKEKLDKEQFDKKNEVDENSRKRSRIETKLEVADENYRKRSRIETKPEVADENSRKRSRIETKAVVADEMGIRAKRKREKSPSVEVRKREKSPSVEVRKREKSPSVEVIDTEVKEEPKPAVIKGLSDVEVISEEETPDSSNEKLIQKLPSPKQPQTEETTLEEEYVTQFEPLFHVSDDTDSTLVVEDIEDLDDSLVEDTIVAFDPSKFELQTLECLPDPSRAKYEWSALSLQMNISDTEVFSKYRDILSKNYEEYDENWVQDVESILPHIENGLLKSTTREEDLDHLTYWCKTGLDFNLAYNQSKPGYKIRHMKVGIILAEVLSNCGEAIVTRLMKFSDVQTALLDLLGEESMATSIKLLLCKALDTNLNYGSTVRMFLNNTSTENGYQRLLRCIRSTTSTRLVHAIGNLLQKIHFFEVLEKFQEFTTPGISVDIESIEISLENIVRYLKNPTRISQCLKFIPVHCQFEQTSVYSNPWSPVYKYLSYFNFLNSVKFLLSDESFHLKIIPLIVELITEMINTSEGLCFLASNKVTNDIVKIILQLISDSNQTADVTSEIPPTFGLILTNRLYVVNCVDKLFTQQNHSVDSIHVIDIMEQLCNLCLTPIGRQSVAYILSLKNFADPFFALLEHDVPETEYVIWQYASDLIAIVIKYSDNIHFVQKYRKQLIKLLDVKEFERRKNWLIPVQNQSVSSYSDISELVNILKDNIDRSPLFPGELIMTARILKYLIIPEKSTEIVELKYRCTKIQFCSNDGMSCLVSILNKICNYYNPPYLYSYLFNGDTSTDMLLLIMPVIHLLHNILADLIQCRKTDFKDLTPIPVLIRLYCLLHAVPSSSAAYLDAHVAQIQLINTLLLYIQPVTLQSSVNCISRTSWSSVISEILNFSINSPDTLVPCLTLLSELLPLPLPVENKTPLSEVESLLILNSRKLWSAHLLPLESLLYQVIVTLCNSCNQVLLELLLRISLQLSDLGPDMAILVVKSILTALLPHLSVGNCTQQICRLLNLLADLAVQPSIKMVLVQVHIWCSDFKCDEFNDLWTLLGNMLISNKEEHSVQCQEYILSVFHSLCDTTISLLSPPEKDDYDLTLSYVINSLPSKDTLLVLCSSMMEQLNTNRDHFSTVLLTLKILINLIHHDFGYVCLRQTFEKHTNTLYKLLKRSSLCWNSEDVLLVGVVSCVVELCTHLHKNIQEHATCRTLFMTAKDLALLIKWDNNTSTEHPLVILQSQMREFDTPDIRNSVSGIIDVLSQVPETTATTSSCMGIMLEPTFPTQEPLVSQFGSRSSFVIREPDISTLNVLYWLSTPSFDNVEDDAELVICDLSEISEGLPCFSLEKELKNLRPPKIEDKKTDPALAGNAKKSDIPQQLHVNKPVSVTKPTTSQRGVDAFRNRVPNSSRAPSMHVDDFVALESKGEVKKSGSVPPRPSAKESPALGPVYGRGRMYGQNSLNYHVPMRPSRGWFHPPPGSILRPFRPPVVLPGMTLRWPPPIRPLRPVIRHMRPFPPM